MFKLRIYFIDGANKGMLDHEEFFDTFAEAKECYEELFEHDHYGYNPTIWESDDDDREEWNRVMEF